MPPRKRNVPKWLSTDHPNYDAIKAEAHRPGIRPFINFAGNKEGDYQDIGDESVAINAVEEAINKYKDNPVETRGAFAATLQRIYKRDSLKDTKGANYVLESTTLNNWQQEKAEQDQEKHAAIIAGESEVGWLPAAHPNYDAVRAEAGSRSIRDFVDFAGKNDAGVYNNIGDEYVAQDALEKIIDKDATLGATTHYKFVRALYRIYAHASLKDTKGRERVWNNAVLKNWNQGRLQQEKDRRHDLGAGNRHLTWLSVDHPNYDAVNPAATQPGVSSFIMFAGKNGKGEYHNIGDEDVAKNAHAQLVQKYQNSPRSTHHNIALALDRIYGHESLKETEGAKHVLESATQNEWKRYGYVKQAQRKKKPAVIGAGDNDVQGSDSAESIISEQHSDRGDSDSALIMSEREAASDVGDQGQWKWDHESRIFTNDANGYQLLYKTVADSLALPQNALIKERQDDGDRYFALENQSGPIDTSGSNFCTLEQQARINEKSLDDVMADLLLPFNPYLPFQQLSTIEGQENFPLDVDEYGDVAVTGDSSMFSFQQQSAGAGEYPSTGKRTRDLGDPAASDTAFKLICERLNLSSNVVDYEIHHYPSGDRLAFLWKGTQKAYPNRYGVPFECDMDTLRAAGYPVDELRQEERSSKRTSTHTASSVRSGFEHMGLSPMPVGAEALSVPGFAGAPAQPTPSVFYDPNQAFQPQLTFALGIEQDILGPSPDDSMPERQQLAASTHDLVASPLERTEYDVLGAFTTLYDDAPTGSIGSPFGGVPEGVPFAGVPEYDQQFEQGAGYREPGALAFPSSAPAPAPAPAPSGALRQLQGPGAGVAAAQDPGGTIEPPKLSSPVRDSRRR